MARIWSLLLYCSFPTVYGSLITQTPSFTAVEAGEDVRLSCSYLKETVSSAVWMQQPAGEDTVTIGSYYASNIHYHNGFDRSGRFKLETAANGINLTISRAQPVDSATYYCGFIYYTEVTFGKGSVLFVKGGNSRSGVFELQRGFESECPKVSIILSSLRLSDAHTHNCTVEACTHFLSANRTAPPAAIISMATRCPSQAPSSCVFWGVLKMVVQLATLLLCMLVSCVRKRIRPPPP